VHNAFTAIGLGQMGQVSEASLAEGAVARFAMDLEPQCYTFAAFGGDGVRAIELTVTDSNSQRVATAAARDPQSTLQYCPTVRGRYTVGVLMAAGSGPFALSSWRGTARGVGTGGPIAQGEGGSGTCRNPLSLQIGQTVTGDTSRMRNSHSGSCAEGEAGEQVYVLQVDRRMLVTIASEQDYDGTLYLRSECEDPDSEIACNDDDRSTSHSRISQVLDPGTYYVFADGWSDDEGSFTLTVTGAEVPSPQEVCQNAPVLMPGQAMSGQTLGEPDLFRASCAAGARGPERVYRLEVPQESRVQISQESDYDGVLYVRRACGEQATEVACNDDAWDTQHARINKILPPGTYYVFADGYAPQSAGSYNLQADLAPVAGVGTQGDSCQDAQPLTIGQPVEGNTFAARDDVVTSCGTAQDGFDVVFRLEVASRSRVRLWFEDSDLRQDGVIYLTRSCAPNTPGAAIGCRANALGEDSALEATLDRGTYYVVVDSASPRTFGRFRLNSRVEDVSMLERLCRTAPLLRSGQAVTGTTSGEDRFRASCAGGARSPENLYRLVLRRRSFVRLALRATSWPYDAALFLRGDCLDPRSERACNDDDRDIQHSLIETTLEAGTYTVFVDGYSNRNSGSYVLETTIQPQ
jgi:hypothetical protein